VGSIVPMGPEVQYATQAPAAPYEVRIYPGADARFTMYEDDNETYNYEKGQRATYDLIWNDRARTLTIGARQGSYPGLVRQRQLKLVLATKAPEAGITPAVVSKQVNYVGKPVVVRF
jgi:alpha-D-xyloside xylohydrolase